MSALHRPDLPAWLLAALALLAITLLAAIGKPIPEVLPVIAGGGLAGGAALPASPRGQRATDTTTRGGR